MGLKNVYELLLEKDQDIFYEGDLVTGSVRILNCADIAYKAINVEILGTAVVVWTNGSGGSIKSSIISSDDEDLELEDLVSEECSKETFLNVVDCVSKGEAEPLMLETGEHYFPFECKLPLELPSSFSGEKGWVRYHVRLIVLTSDVQTDDDVKVRKPFTVVNGLDLSFIPEAASKIEVCKYRDIGVCCTEGSVTCEWNVVRSGYVAGESIWIQGSVQNESRRAVAKSLVSLVLVVEYKSSKKSKRETREVAVVEKGGTASGDMSLWNDPLIVPILPPTGLGRCQLIDISYQLEFKALLEGNYSPIVVRKPIYIGTVRMSLAEMRSFTSALYGRPLASASSYQSLDPLPDTPGPAQLSLIDIIASVGICTTPESPSAPDFTALDSPLLELDSGGLRSDESKTEEKESEGNVQTSVHTCKHTSTSVHTCAASSYKYTAYVVDASGMTGLNVDGHYSPTYHVVRPPPFAPGHEPDCPQSQVFSKKES